MAVHVVQKKINWANKDAVVVVADHQQKKHPSMPRTERNNNTEGDKRKEKAARRPKKTSLCQKGSKKVRLFTVPYFPVRS